MLYHTKSVYETLADLETGEHGLSQREVGRRLTRYGTNSLRVRGEPLWKKLIEPFADVFVGVLIVAALISMWHHAYLDAGIIVGIIMISAIIYYVQRFSTERILRALQKKNPLEVTVIRDGQPTTIDASFLVPGDCIEISEGEKIAADARLITVNSLRVDEAQLTGESLPIDKQAEALDGKKEVYEQTNMVFQGSFVVGGQARAIVVRTGNSTEFGKLAVLSQATSDLSPVQIKINKLIQQLVMIISILSIVTFFLAVWRGIPIEESLRFVIALAVSAVPEGLPIAITVVLVLGMRRMARKKALVRTMRSIETVGIITTIATDKTGTLTKNKLRVQEVWQPDHTAFELKPVIAAASNLQSAKVHDPLDIALAEYAHKHAKKSHLEPAVVFPFDQATAMSGNLWHRGENYELALKGAPEQIIAVCDLTEGEREKITRELHRLTSQGFRVIAFAVRTMKRPVDSLTDFTSHHKLEFVGLVAIADMLRPEAKGAIKTALAAGVTVRMITGDHYETAYHIGRELGILDRYEQVFDSRKLSVISDEELEREIEHIRVFARVVPEQKHRILTILKKHNIAAMTGDGVNDVPALTNAHVGVAMGSGSQIAKDAGDIILLDDNFKSIVTAVHEGRTIYANIKRMVAYLLSTNLGEVIVSMLAIALGLPLPLVPVQLLWINLVTDTAMVIPLGLEPGDKGSMKRPPTPPHSQLLSKFMISRIFIIAITMSAVTLGFYITYMDRYGLEYGRSVAFISLVIMQWASAFCFRSNHETVFRHILRPSWPFYLGLIIALSMQALVVFGPLADLLHTTRISLGDLAYVGCMSFVIPIIVIELHKWLGRRIRL